MPSRKYQSHHKLNKKRKNTKTFFAVFGNISMMTKLYYEVIYIKKCNIEMLNSKII